MKEIYIEEYDRLIEEAMEEGHSEAEAERIADAGAYRAMTDRYADMADRARDAAKYAEFD